MQVSPLDRRLLALWVVMTCAALLATGCDKDPLPLASPGAASSLAPAAVDAGVVRSADVPPALADPLPGPDGKVRLSEDAWRARLTPEQFKILRGAGTERPFSCPLWKIADEPGIYHCAGCGFALFDSADKFDSGTGWPSFGHPIAAGRILEETDRSHGMVRVEALCARCEGHLGHVFDDGPPPRGKRYCINGTVLRFEPRGDARSGARSTATEDHAPAKAQP
jgi:peptide-methionine (R)-S-oxide reductase